MNEFMGLDSLSQNERISKIKAIVKQRLSQCSTSDKATLQGQMSSIISDMIGANLSSMESLRAAMQGANEALVGKDEQEVITLIDQKDIVQRKIDALQEEIKQKLNFSFKCAKEAVASSQLEHKDILINALDSFIERETRLIKILKEATQTALLNIVEQGQDVANSTQQLIGSMSYKILREGEFSTQRVLHVSKTLIQASVEVAELNGIYANKIVSGAILGARDGVYRLIKRLKSDSHFAPDELHLGEQLKELQGIDENFIKMLQDLADSTNKELKEQINYMAKNELVNHFERLGRLIQTAKDQIKRRIDELEANPKVSELVKASHETINELSKGAKKLKQAAMQLKDKIIKSE